MKPTTPAMTPRRKLAIAIRATGFLEIARRAFLGPSCV